MRERYCDRCGSGRWLLVDMENGTVEARCLICGKAVKLKLAEEK